MFAVLCLLLCKYLVCDLHNFNKTMAFITSNLRFQLHVTECFKDISMKSIIKRYRFVCQFILRNPHISHIYFYKNLYLHDQNDILNEPFQMSGTFVQNFIC